jgi:O-antigen/teichoic acid export membrane protein
MNSAQRVAKNILSLLLSGMLTEIIAFFTIIYLARVLGPRDFGMISFASAIILYFTLLTHLGLPLLGTRAVARNKTKINEYFSNILLLRLCLAIASLALLAIFILFLDAVRDVKVLIILYGAGLFAHVLMIDWVFKGVQKMEYIAVAKIFSAVIFAGAVFLIVEGRQQLFMVPCFQVAGIFSAAIFLIFAYGRKVHRIEIRFEFSKFRNLFVRALPIGFSFLMIQVFYNIDSVMLGFMTSTADVGIYSAAYKPVMVMIAFIGLYPEAIFPMFSAYYSNRSFDSLKDLMSLSVKLLVTIGIPLIIGGAILAGPLMQLLYGPTYGEGKIAFQILLLAVLIICFNISYSRGLLACNKDKLYMAGVTVPAAVNVVSNFILIPAFGLAGAAVATLIAEATGFIIIYRGFNRYIAVPLLPYVVKPLAAGSIMAIFLFTGKVLVDLNLFLLIALSIIIYFASLFFLKGITRDELVALRNLLPLNDFFHGDRQRESGIR